MSVNPLQDEVNPRYEKYHGPAWQAKRDGRPAEALRIWEPLLNDVQECAEMGIDELIALYQQMAVCWRLLWRHDLAETCFTMASLLAYRAEKMRQFRAIQLDRTAGWLDRGEAYRAVDLLEPMLANLDDSDEQYLDVKGYLGRAYGQVPGCKKTALQYLPGAIELADGRPDRVELQLDMLIWMLEIRFWRGRRECRAKALALASQVAPTRVKDVELTYYGGRPARQVARRLMAVQYRLKK